MSLSAGHSAPLPTIEVSWGELVDKITILEIKQQRLTSPQAVANVRRELVALRRVYDHLGPTSAKLETLKWELKAVNERLWVIEDDIRVKEKQQAFDAEFIRLARAVYFENDERARIKKDINLALGSSYVEEKSYEDYRAPAS